MQRRRFGRTGFDISAFTLGGGFVGGILIHPPEAVRLEALRRITAAGCDWIDTAADYGKGESEATLGRLLPQIDSQPRISTKVRIDPADKDDLASQIRRSLEASLERLGRDSVELFQLHNQIGRDTHGRTLAASEVLRPGGVADVFDQLREEGLFKAQGITALGDAGPIIEVIDSGRFDTAQVYYNMINPSAALAAGTPWSGHGFCGVLEACRRHDMGVMCIRVLAAGVLATSERHGREMPVYPEGSIASEEADAQRLFAMLGDDHGTHAQTAIRFALSRGDLSTIVVGLETLDQLDEALAAFEAGPLPDVVVEAILNDRP